MLSKMDQKILVKIYKNPKRFPGFSEHNCITKDLTKWGFNKSRIGKSLRNLKKYAMIEMFSAKDLAFQYYDIMDQKKSAYKEMLNSWYSICKPLKYKQTRIISLTAAGEDLAGHLAYGDAGTFVTKYPQKGPTSSSSPTS